MRIHFCGMCHESVPQADLDVGIARLHGSRAICTQCLSMLRERRLVTDAIVAKRRILLQLPADIADNGHAKPVAPIRAVAFLWWFRWICYGTAREDVEQIIDDLRRDRRNMLDEGRSDALIRRVQAHQAFMCVFRIVWRGVKGIATVWKPRGGGGSSAGA